MEEPLAALILLIGPTAVLAFPPAATEMVDGAAVGCEAGRIAGRLNSQTSQTPLADSASPAIINVYSTVGRTRSAQTVGAFFWSQSNDRNQPNTLFKKATMDSSPPKEAFNNAGLGVPVIFPLSSNPDNPRPPPTVARRATNETELALS